MTLPSYFNFEQNFNGGGGQLFPVDDYTRFDSTTFFPQIEITDDLALHSTPGGEISPGHSTPFRRTSTLSAPAFTYSVKYIVNGILIPGILTFGAIGNALCLALIVNRVCRCPRLLPTGRRPHHSGQFSGSPCPNRVNITTNGCGNSTGGRRKLQPLERTALVGLGVLALSDLLFCLVGVPAAWLPLNSGSAAATRSSGGMLAQYYSIYRYPLHNLFLVSSCWIAVTIAIERCIAVGCPIRARWFLKARYSVVAALLIFVAAALLSGPMFYRQRLMVFNCSSPAMTSLKGVESPQTTTLIPLPTTTTPLCSVITPTGLFSDRMFRAVYFGVVSAIGTFIPLLLLTISSGGLVWILYRSRMAGITSPDRYPCTRVTVTVTGVVISFVVLVCPSILVEAFQAFNGQPLGDGFLSAVLFTNLSQAIWFGANFLFYCGCANIRGRFRNRSGAAGGPTTCQVALQSLSPGGDGDRTAGRLRPGRPIGRELSSCPSDTGFCSRIDLRTATDISDSAGELQPAQEFV